MFASTRFAALALALAFASGCLSEASSEPTAADLAALEPARPAALAGCTYNPAPCSTFSDRTDTWQYTCTYAAPPNEPVNGYPFNPLNVPDDTCHFVAFYVDHKEQALYCCAPDSKSLNTKIN